MFSSTCYRKSYSCCRHRYNPVKVNCRVRWAMEINLLIASDYCETLLFTKSSINVGVPIRLPRKRLPWHILNEHWCRVLRDSAKVVFKLAVISTHFSSFG